MASSTAVGPGLERVFPGCDAHFCVTARDAEGALITDVDCKTTISFRGQDLSVTTSIARHLGTYRVQYNLRNCDVGEKKEEEEAEHVVVEVAVQGLPVAGSPFHVPVVVVPASPHSYSLRRDWTFQCPVAEGEFVEKVCVDERREEIYILCSQSRVHRMRVLSLHDPQGTLARTWPDAALAGVKQAGGLAVCGRTGEVFLTDMCGSVVVFDTQGALLRRWGSSGRAKGVEFQRPKCVEVVGDDVYVADTENARVSVFTRHGVWRHTWHTANSNGSDNTSMYGSNRPWVDSLTVSLHAHTNRVLRHSLRCYQEQQAQCFVRGRDQQEEADEDQDEEDGSDESGVIITESSAVVTAYTLRGTPLREIYSGKWDKVYHLHRPCLLPGVGDEELVCVGSFDGLRLLSLDGRTLASCPVHEKKPGGVGGLSSLEAMCVVRGEQEEERRMDCVRWALKQMPGPLVNLVCQYALYLPPRLLCVVDDALNSGVLLQQWSAVVVPESQRAAAASLP